MALQKRDSLYNLSVEEIGAENNRRERTSYIKDSIAILNEKQRNKDRITLIENLLCNGEWKIEEVAYEYVFKTEKDSIKQKDLIAFNKKLFNEGWFYNKPNLDVEVEEYNEVTKFVSVVNEKDFKKFEYDKIKKKYRKNGVYEVKTKGRFKVEKGEWELETPQKVIETRPTIYLSSRKNKFEVQIRVINETALEVVEFEKSNLKVVENIYGNLIKKILYRNVR